MSQHRYIEKILCGFEIDNAKPAVNLIEIRKIEALPGGYECPLEDRTSYARAIELLMYAVVETGMDIAYSVLFFSRYLKNLGPQHMYATKNIIRYLRRITNLELNFCRDLKPLVGYINSD